MAVLNIFAVILITSQFVFLAQMVRNFLYVIKKTKKIDHSYRPRTALIIPCKGIDSEFEKNIASFYLLDYSPYSLHFVVEENSDDAYAHLHRIMEKFKGKSRADSVAIYVAGKAKTSSQKLHNLMYVVSRLPADVEVYAFADSDACTRKDWLSHLIYPLRKEHVGVSSGYRWYVPLRNNSATIVLAVLNSKIAQLLGTTRFNQAWGGSMAIKSQTFHRIGADKIWAVSVSDDLTLSSAAKKAGLTVGFVPACLVASYEQTTWPKLLEFARRQFLITRITAAGTWWFGLLSSLFSVLGFWGAGIAAIVLKSAGSRHYAVFALISLVFLCGQIIRSLLRQMIAARLLADEKRRLVIVGIADLAGCPLWSVVMLIFILSSAFGRTIQWRGIKYKLLGPNQTVVLE